MRTKVPERIQLRRTRGWRKPEGAIVVSRPSRWGNPIRITPERGRYCRMYRVHGSPLDITGGPSYCDMDTARHFAAWLFQCDLLNGRYPNYPSLDEIRTELAGHDLACWCPPRRVNRNGSLGSISCHADVLLEIANQEGR
ncbi:DUF4326 domain-containing protein [Mycobacteroides abscessus]|uniref:DUF4326 domain-containing protein n=1 Tax=Mycobacteroides abscessus TaxID=36809 RepID=UPI0018969BA5